MPLLAQEIVTSDRRTTILNAVEICLRNGVMPNLVGYTGVGKTTMVEEIARRTGRKLINLNLATQEPGDLIGLPYEKNGETHWALPCWWPKDGNCIIFFDEINRGRKDVMNAIMPLILTKELHVEHKIDPNVWIISAMNPNTEDFDMVFSFDDAAVISRMVMLEVKSDFDEWEEWMKKEGRYNDKISSFLKLNLNNHFFLPDIKEVMNVPIKPNPRSWTKFIQMVNYCVANNLKSTEELCLIAAGFLGPDVTSQITATISNIFQNVSFSTSMDITDDNAMSLANAFVSDVVSGKIDIRANKEENNKFMRDLCLKQPSVFKYYLPDLFKEQDLMDCEIVMELISLISRGA